MLPTLRPTSLSDLPLLYHFQLDELSNRLAGTKPRDERTFIDRWHAILRDPSITPRVILLGEAVVGSIDCFQYETVRDGVPPLPTREGPHCIGYWIDRPHWARGLATHAIGLLLREVPIRPLYARVAAHNTPSIRALARHGFTEIARVLKPGGRVAISDLVLLRPLPSSVRADVEALVGCVAGASLAALVESFARRAGLKDIQIRRRGDYIDAMTTWEDPLYKAIIAKLAPGETIGTYVTSAEITARK